MTRWAQRIAALRQKARFSNHPYTQRPMRAKFGLAAADRLGVNRFRVERILVGLPERSGNNSVRPLNARVAVRRLFLLSVWRLLVQISLTIPAEPVNAVQIMTSVL